MHSWRLRNSLKRVVLASQLIHSLLLSPTPMIFSCYKKGIRPLHLVLLGASAVLSMAWWLALHSVFILFICMASSGVVSPTEQGSNHSNSLALSIPKSDATSFERTSPSDLSWPASYAPTTLFKNDRSLATAENAYNLTIIPLAAPRIQCASTYGSGLNIASCQEAWELLPTSSTRRTFGQRAEGNFDVPLPFRVLSRQYDHNQCSAIDFRACSCAYLLKWQAR